MLILSRKRGQRIAVIVGNVTTWITLVDGCDQYGNVRIGFDAPAEVEILREELIEASDPLTCVDDDRR